MKISVDSVPYRHGTIFLNGDGVSRKRLLDDDGRDEEGKQWCYWESNYTDGSWRELGPGCYQRKKFTEETGFTSGKREDADQGGEWETETTQ